jgi:hypothetical protein
MKPSGGLSRKTPLSRVSGKRAALHQRRRAFVAQMLQERPRCQARLSEVCRGHAVDVHEILTRARGGDILDPANVLCVCRACHRWIHAHPLEATARGLLRSSWMTSSSTS